MDKNNVGYPIYGGRGITIHEPWISSFPLFLAHIGFAPSNKHSIDRIDSDGGYVPGNVRWATAKEQSRNRKYCRSLTMDGRTMTFIDWAKETGIKASTITYRIKAGWPAERALSTPAFYRGQ